VIIFQTQIVQFRSRKRR